MQATGLSAFQALANALPDLRTRYADGQVFQLISKQLDQHGESETWQASIWTPEQKRTDMYDVSRGQLRGPMAVSSVGPDAGPQQLPLISSLAETQASTLLDSPQALRFADAGGGQQFQELTGGQPAHADLHGRPDGGFQWTIHYALPNNKLGLIIQLDALSGEVRSVHDYSAQNSR